MSQILTIVGQGNTIDRARTIEFSKFLSRLSSFNGETKEILNSDLVEILENLFKRNLLTYEIADDRIQVLYIPSANSCKSLVNYKNTIWPDRINKAHVDAFRKSEGAIFHFPVEDDIDNNIEVFITDWSPCPAACALAIHWYHPFAREIYKDRLPLFTGKYVRHPLTGDLLPVWIADWVKPAFGTGAVLVNPAHDRVDMAFGRLVGFPIRFCLVPETFNGKPETWPIPPVIKTGRTIKTGAYDGLSPVEAMDKYFSALRDNGLAESYMDIRPDVIKLCTFIIDDASDVYWCKNCGSIGRVKSKCMICNNEPLAIRLDSFETLAAIASTIESNEPNNIVCQLSEIDKGLLAFRLLYYEMKGESFEPQALTIVQKVQETKSVYDLDNVVYILTLVGAPINQVVVLKEQMFEQVKRFIRIHNEFLESSIKYPRKPFGMNVKDPLIKQFVRIRKLIESQNIFEAFNQLYKLQKQLNELNMENAGSILSFYYVLAFILTGADFPSDIDLGQYWALLDSLDLIDGIS